MSASRSETPYAPGATGLLIVDPYNDFLSDGGKLHALSRDTLEVNDVVAHMRQIVERVGNLLVQH